MASKIQEDSKEYSVKDISDRFVTVMGILVGFGAAPAVFIWTFLHIRRCVSWMDDRGITDSIWTLVGVMAFGIAWSVFAAFGWKRGNPGIRIGLTLLIWAFVAGVVAMLIGVALARFI